MVSKVVLEVTPPEASKVVFGWGEKVLSMLKCANSAIYLAGRLSNDPAEEDDDIHRRQR